MNRCSNCFFFICTHVQLENVYGSAGGHNNQIWLLEIYGMGKIDKTKNVGLSTLVADNTSSLDYLAFSLEYSRRVQL